MMTADSVSCDILEMLQGLPPRHFEQFIADVWQEQQGWATEVMDKGPDKGLDIIGQPPRGGSKTAVQCKRYAIGNKITSRNVQQYAALRQQWDDIEGVTIVTTSSFTKDAEELSKRMNVKCIDGGSLVRLIKKYDAIKILEWYDAGKPDPK